MTEEQEQPQSFILCRFADIGSVVLDVTFESVTPLQVLALSEYLSVKGKNELVRQENERLSQEAQQNVSVPESMDKLIIAR